MTAIPSWQAIRDAEDAKVRASGHAGLCSRARRLMPKLNAEDAVAMRRAMFAGPGCGLRELVIKHFVPLLAILLLCGCGERVQLNPGADLAIYSGSTAHMHATLPPGLDRATSIRLGYYSPTDGSITLHEQLRGLGAARVFAHELAHAFDHQKPFDVWELLLRYQSADFNFNLHAQEADIKRARDAASAATQASL